jgi:hypothetical protein
VTSTSQRELRPSSLGCLFLYPVQYCNNSQHPYKYTGDYYDYYVEQYRIHKHFCSPKRSFMRLSVILCTRWN